MSHPSNLIRRCAEALAIINVAAAMTSCSVIKTAIGQQSPSPPVTYYVSLSGNDAASGTSPSTAWRTLSNLNAAAIPPGSKILFHGGDRFIGQLKLGKDDAGNASKPVTIESYGNGMATIYAPGESGVTVYDTAGIDIRNLKLVGSGKTGNGINAYNDLPADNRLKHINISDVQVSGFYNGISIGGVHTAAGFIDVQVSNSTSYGNVDRGLSFFGPGFDGKSPTYANQDVVVSHVAARGNLGDSSNTWQETGSGIVLNSVAHGTVTWSTATRNGGRGKASSEGVGIWTYNSTGITISHNLSYENMTANKIDGGGFDLDDNVTDSVLEDNISYGNDGPGYLVYSYNYGGVKQGNVVRNNISSDDVRDQNSYYGGITISGSPVGVLVYQNTVTAKDSAALKIGSTVHHAIVANNILTTQSGPILRVGNSLVPDAVTFQGNDYYSAGSWQLAWETQTYWSLSTWQHGTKQEMRNGQATGHAVAPELAGRTLKLAIESPTDTTAVRSFELASGSPMSGAGLDLATLGMATDTANFLGQARAAQHPNVGAF